LQAGGLGEGNVADISNGAFAPAFNTGGPTSQHVHDFSTGGQNANHVHAINNSTDGAALRHQHGYTVPAHSGASGAPAAAVAPTNANLPPYLAINYIIRVA
jgi:hypothetical protein